jgi:hypothetical protein
MIAVLIAAQVAAPAAAADLTSPGVEATRTGAFAGARLRISLDAKPRERFRAGFAVAPTVRQFRSDGSTRLRIGEGTEFGISDRKAPGLSLAGKRLSDIAPRGEGPKGPRQNISTIGWVAIGVVAVVGTLYVLAELCAEGEICGSDRDN